MPKSKEKGKQNAAAVKATKGAQAEKRAKSAAKSKKVAKTAKDGRAQKGATAKKPAASPPTPNREAPTPASAAKPDNQRRHGRVHCQLTSCTLGEILDLSASGARVRSRKKPLVKPGDQFSLSIETPFGPVIVRARLIWRKTRGWRWHEMGIEFVELTPKLRDALAENIRVITLHSVRRMDPRAAA